MDDVKLGVGYSFYLDENTPNDIQMIKANAVIAGWFARDTQRLEVTCFEQLHSGVYVAAIIRSDSGQANCGVTLP